MRFVHIAYHLVVQQENSIVLAGIGGDHGPLRSETFHWRNHPGRWVYLSGIYRYLGMSTSA